MTTLSWERARDLAAALAHAPAPADVPLSEAYGCRLAEPLRALVPVPGADVSAMDGYAVCGPPPWRVTGRVLAGGAPGPALSGGEAAEIATGAPVPEGTWSVLPYEVAEAADGWVKGVAERGRHVRFRGEDVPAGAVVLGAGSVVTPAVLGLAAGLGHDRLRVLAKPAVSVLVTGDEVVFEGLPGPGRVRDAIGPMLPGLVAWAGGRVTGNLRLPDGAEALRAALAGTAPGSGPAAPARPADVVVVCGASSKGPADHLRAVLGDAEVLIDGVAVRPGHPQILARLASGALLVGLPGNPFAALGAAMTLLVPILGGPRRGEMSALAGKVRAHPRDTRLVPVRRGENGAVPVGHDRPGSLWGAALAEALAVVPPGWEGGQVELIELP
ncbi:molybdopterin molybdotransferase MoeA [Nonomuraea typhae]|uniref:molybdopterin molybdotransferase MoeA n=1 Tax=Nonomuraea typhae TaxID=2603600 RepID=UPI001FEA02D3|nr:molybdopterin molybdotransferase MoeA [Nonomuraea typhae]